MAYKKIYELTKCKSVLGQSRAGWEWGKVPGTSQRQYPALTEDEPKQRAASSVERTSAGNDTHDKQLENPCQCHVAECLQQAPRERERGKRRRKKKQ